MNTNLEDEITNITREYVKTRIRAEKTRDPKLVKKIKFAERNLRKAEDEADKTMNPELRKRCNVLLNKIHELQNRSKVSSTQ